MASAERRKFDGYITYADLTGQLLKVWAHINRHNAEEFERVMIQYAKSFEQRHVPKLEEIKKDTLVVVYEPKDEKKWFRGKVLDILPTARKVKCQLYDYGPILCIDPEFIRLPPSSPDTDPIFKYQCLAITAYVANLYAKGGEWTEVAAKFIERLCYEDLYGYYVGIHSDSTPFLELFRRDDTSLSTLIIAAGFGQTSSVVQPPQQLDLVKQVEHFHPVKQPQTQLKLHEPELGSQTVWLISPAHVLDGIKKFYGQLVSKYDIVQRIEKYLSQQLSKDGLKPIRSLQLNSFYLAAYRHPNPNMKNAVVVSRAKVLGVHGEQVQVLLVDYGMCYNLPTTALHELIPDVSSEPMTAVQLCLPYQSAFDQLPSATLTSIFERRYQATQLWEAHVLGKSPNGGYTVQLIDRDSMEQMSHVVYAETQAAVKQRLSAFSVPVPVTTATVDVSSTSLTPAGGLASSIIGGTRPQSSFDQEVTSAFHPLQSSQAPGFQSISATNQISAFQSVPLTTNLSSAAAVFQPERKGSDTVSLHQQQLQQLLGLVPQPPTALNVNAPVFTPGGPSAGPVPSAIVPTGAPAMSLPMPTVNVAPQQARLTATASPINQKRLSLNYRDVCAVTEIIDPDNFYVHLTTYKNELNCLMMKLRATYNAVDADRKWTVAEIFPRMLVAFKLEEHWYRGLVEKVFVDNIQVFCMDYGNTEIVPKTDVLHLDPSMASLESFAIHCCLEDVYNKGVWTDAHVKEFRRFAPEAEALRIKIIREVESFKYSVGLFTMDGQSINAQFGEVTGTLSTKSEMAPAISTAPDVTGTVRRPVPTAVNLLKSYSIFVGQQLSVQMSAAENPRRFWLQPVAELGNLIKMQQELQGFYGPAGLGNHQGPSQQLEVGSVCAALYQLDENWYRAIVRGLTADGKALTVFFVDYGNSENVDRSNVRTLAPQFTNLPAFALECSMNGVAPSQPDGCFSLKEVDAFQEFCDERFIAEVLACNNSVGGGGAVLTVDLFDTSKQPPISVAQQFMSVTSRDQIYNFSQQGALPPVQQPIGKAPGAFQQQVQKTLPLSVPAAVLPLVPQVPALPFPMLSFVDPNKLEKVVVVEVDNPSSFVVQPLSANATLNSVGNALNAQSMLKKAEMLAAPLPNVKPGELCIACYHVDNLWYRAMILQQASANEVSVYFVDYGNTSKVAVTNLRQLPADPVVAASPLCAMRCSLRGIVASAPNGQWSVDAIEEFKRLAQVGSQVYSAAFYGRLSADTYQVDLSDASGKSVAMMLVQAQKAVIISTGPVVPSIAQSPAKLVLPQLQQAACVLPVANIIGRTSVPVSGGMSTFVAVQ